MADELILLKEHIIILNFWWDYLWFWYLRALGCDKLFNVSMYIFNVICINIKLRIITYKSMLI